MELKITMNVEVDDWTANNLGLDTLAERIIGIVDGERIEYEYEVTGEYEDACDIMEGTSDKLSATLVDYKRC